MIVHRPKDLPVYRELTLPRRSRHHIRRDAMAENLITWLLMRNLKPFTISCGVLLGICELNAAPTVGASH